MKTEGTQPESSHTSTGTDLPATAGSLMGSGMDVAFRSGKEAKLALQARKEGSKDPLPSLIGANLVGLDLSGCDLAGLDFQGADLSRCDLSGANLLGANLVGACLFEANCQRAEFAGAVMHNANLASANLQNASLAHAKMSRANLEGANLEGAGMVEVDATRASFQLANLSRTRMQNAILDHACFTKANMEFAELDFASLENANFFRAETKGASFKEVKFYESASWIGVNTSEMDATGAYLLVRFIRDQNYLEEFKGQSKWHSAVYWVWWLTSDCGRSLSRWGLLTATLVFVFAGLYLGMSLDYGDHETWLSPVYFSVATITTLGYGDVVPASVTAQVTSMLQVSVGYMMLGGLVSILSNKLARRAD